MLFLTSDGINISLETHGTNRGKPLVLIHGLGADRRQWQPQVECYPAEGYRLIVPELRGHGKSNPAIPFLIEECARDIAELLDFLEIERASVIGSGLGGLIAQSFGIDYPDRLKALILVDSYCSPRGFKRILNGMLANPFCGSISKKKLARRFSKLYDKAALHQLGRYYRNMIEEMDLEQIRLAREAMKRFRCDNRLGAVKAPTLVMNGDGFGAKSLESGREIVSRIPMATFKVLAGGYDPTNLTASETFNKAVLAFLKSG